MRSFFVRDREPIRINVRGRFKKTFPKPSDLTVCRGLLTHGGDCGIICLRCLGQLFGFSFYLFEDFHSSSDEKTHFPEWFTAFGFNDGTQTMVFLGFLCYGEDDQPYCANVDFSEFLMHYYGDWFDWEAGVGYTSSEATAD